MARRRRPLASSNRRGFGRRMSGPQRRRRTSRRTPASNSSGIIINTIRRMMLVPSQMNVTPAAGPTPGWLNLAQNTLSVLMSAMAMSLRDETKLPTTANQIVMSGNAVAFAIGVDELLYASPLSRDVGSVLSPTTFIVPIRTCAYRQAMVEWIKIQVFPCSDPSVRSGQIVSALVPFANDAEIADLILSKQPEMTFDTIMSLPGARMRPADKPFTVMWRNTHRVWSEVGGKNSATSYLGGDPLVRFHFHFSDFASESDQLVSEYRSNHATFAMVVSSRLRLRSPNLADDRTWLPSPLSIDNIKFPLRPKVLQFNDPKVVTLDGRPVSNADIRFKEGKWFYLASTPSESFDMCGPSDPAMSPG